MAPVRGTKGPDERLDGRNWLLMVVQSIVLTISNLVYRPSNEEQDGQNEFMAKIKPCRGPFIQTHLRLRLNTILAEIITK